MTRTRYPQIEDTISTVLATFARRPEYQSVFPLGVSLAQWVTA